MFDPGGIVLSQNEVNGVQEWLYLLVTCKRLSPACI